MRKLADEINDFFCKLEILFTFTLVFRQSEIMRQITFIFLVAGIIIFAKCSNSPTDEKQNTAKTDSVKKPEKNPYENAPIEVKTYRVDSTNATKGYGYDIYVWGQPMIHQPNIPAIPGNSGFKTEEYAKKAGEFAAMKIKKNIMPPGVSPEELDSLGVLR